MSWCPKCKTEYRPGANVCADCGTVLVDEIESSGNAEAVELAELLKEEDVKKLVEFLSFSQIDDVVSKYSEESSTWKVSVNERQYTKASKLLKAFYTAETTEDEKAEDKTKQKENALKNNTYVKKEDKYQDFKSSATTFLPFGVIGLIFVVLNAFGILSLLSSPLQYIVITGLFLGFIYVGATSWIKLKSIKQEISSEQDNTSKITEWMQVNITEEILSSVTDDSKSDEVNYIYRTDRMKELILNEFGDLDENFVDHLIEEYYTQNIDLN